MKRKSLYGGGSSSNPRSSSYGNSGLKKRLSEPVFEKKKIHDDYDDYSGSAGFDASASSTSYDKASLQSQIDQDDMEIERLEKLLGIKKKKNSRTDAAAKLDREFEKFEGIGDNFGSFLLGLDELTDDITGKKKKAKEESSESESDSESGSDSEKSDDIPTDIDTDDEERLDKEIEDEIREEYGSASESEESEEDSEMDSDEEKEKKRQFKGEKADYFKPTKGQDIYGRSLSNSDTPVAVSKFLQGDDFSTYLKNFLSSSAASAGVASSRYLTPSAKKKLEEERMKASGGAGTISATEEELKKSVISLMNKLNGSNKDILLKELVALYEDNSKNLFNKIFLSSILSTFFNTNKILYNFLSISSLVLSSFFIIFGNDFNSFYIENIVLILREKLNEYCKKLKDFHDQSQQKKKRNSDDVVIELKLLKNTILSLVIFITYLYSFRVLNHSLVIDLLKDLIDESQYLPSSLVELDEKERVEKSFFLIPSKSEAFSSLNSEDNSFLYEELRFEIISTILMISNDFLRSDDPMSLKILIQLTLKKLNKIKEEKAKLDQDKDEKEEDGDEEEEETSVNFSRLEYFIQLVLNIKNNRQHTSKDYLQLDEIKSSRKFLGQVKTNFKNLLQDNQIQFHLKDFFLIESKGRWWKLGAKYNNSEEKIKKKVDDSDINANTNGDILLNKNLLGGESKNEGSTLNNTIIKLIKKLKIKTEFKQNVFYIIMSSRNLYDTYESLIKLLNYFNTKNSNSKTNEREMIRSLIEFNNFEKTYNLFYSELLNQFIEANRQNKITIQYYYWDFIKVLMDENNTKQTSSEDKKLLKQMSNMNNLILYFIKNFSLSLVILKLINVDQLTINVNEKLISFLINFLLNFFNLNLDDDNFVKLIDRLATSKDYYIVKNTFLFFIQKYMVKINKRMLLEHQIITDANDEKSDEVLKSVNKKKKIMLKVLKDMEILDLTGINNAESGGSKKKGKRSFDDDDYAYEDFN